MQQCSVPVAALLWVLLLALSSADATCCHSVRGHNTGAPTPRTMRKFRLLVVAALVHSAIALYVSKPAEIRGYYPHDTALFGKIPYGDKGIWGNLCSRTSTRCSCRRRRSKRFASRTTLLVGDDAENIQPLVFLKTTLLQNHNEQSCVICRSRSRCCVAAALLCCLGSWFFVL